jgi:hypothetical protein
MAGGSHVGSPQHQRADESPPSLLAILGNLVGCASETKITVRRNRLATPWPQLAQEEIRAHCHWQGFVNCGAGLLPPYQKLPRASDMRVLLIEDDSATAQSIELMLKSESFDLYTTDRGGWSNVVGPFANRKAARPAAQPPAHPGSVELVTFRPRGAEIAASSNVNGRWRLRLMAPGS